MRSSNIQNIPLETLQKRSSMSPTLSQNLIFLLNRGETDQLQLLSFLVQLTSIPDLNDFFYANDARVLLDILIRDLERSEDQVLALYLQLLPNLLEQYPFLHSEKIKLSNLVTLLMRIGKDEALAKYSEKAVSVVLEGMSSVIDYSSEKSIVQ